MRLGRTWIPALALVVTTACAHGGPIVLEQDRQRLERRQDDYLSALSDRDAERTVAHFAEDAIIHVANMPPLRGREAIGRFYGNVFRSMSASASTPETLRVSAGADLAYGTGRVTNVFQGEQGPVEYTGKYLLVWENRGGEWSIVAYSISSDQPGPGR